MHSAVKLRYSTDNGENELAPEACCVDLLPSYDGNYVMCMEKQPCLRGHLQAPIRVHMNAAIILPYQDFDFASDCCLRCNLGPLSISDHVLPLHLPFGSRNFSLPTLRQRAAALGQPCKFIARRCVRIAARCVCGLSRSQTHISRIQIPPTFLISSTTYERRFFYNLIFPPPSHTNHPIFFSSSRTWQ